MANWTWLGKPDASFTNKILSSGDLDSRDSSSPRLALATGPGRSGAENRPGCPHANRNQTDEGME